MFLKHVTKMSDYFFTSSSKDCQQLHIDFFTFRRNKIRNGKEYWNCEENCGAVCVTVNNIIESVKNDHCHLPDVRKVNKLKCLEKMKTYLDENVSKSLRESYSYVMSELRRGTSAEKEIAGLHLHFY